MIKELPADWRLLVAVLALGMAVGAYLMNVFSTPESIGELSARVDRQTERIDMLNDRLDEMSRSIDQLGLTTRIVLCTQSGSELDESARARLNCQEFDGDP